MTFSLAPLSMEKLRESRETSGIANCAWILTQNDDEKKSRFYLYVYNAALMNNSNVTKIDFNYLIYCFLIFILFLFYVLLHSEKILDWFLNFVSLN